MIILFLFSCFVILCIIWGGWMGRCLDVILIVLFVLQVVLILVMCVIYFGFVGIFLSVVLSVLIVLWILFISVIVGWNVWLCLRGLKLMVIVVCLVSGSVQFIFVFWLIFELYQMMRLVFLMRLMVVLELSGLSILVVQLCVFGMEFLLDRLVMMSFCRWLVNVVMILVVFELCILFLQMSVGCLVLWISLVVVVILLVGV